MPYEDFTLLRVEVGGRVCRVTIDNPPINLLDVPLMLELDRLGRRWRPTPTSGCWSSGRPTPSSSWPTPTSGPSWPCPREALAEPPADLGFFHAMVDRFRTMPVATIAVVEGIARGGGCELVSSFDMRVAARGRAVFGQPEALVGIIPGGSGTQRLPRLVGRARALEIVLGGADVDADTADRWGLVNRALPPDEVGPFVDALAARIASLPAVVVAEAKASVAAAEPDPVPGLRGSGSGSPAASPTPRPAARMERFLAAGGQTADVERQPITLADGAWT